MLSNGGDHGPPHFYCKFDQTLTLAARAKCRSLWNYEIHFVTETLSGESEGGCDLTIAKLWGFGIAQFLECWNCD